MPDTPRTTVPDTLLTSMAESSISDHPAPTELKSLTKLPPETQSRIWALAFPTRNFVTIEIQSVEMMVCERSKGKQMLATFSTPTPNPAYADPSRDVDTFCYAPTFMFTRICNGRPGTIKFNYALDVAFFSRGPGLKRSCPFDFLAQADMERMEQIAIDVWGPHFARTSSPNSSS